MHNEELIQQLLIQTSDVLTDLHTTQTDVCDISGKKKFQFCKVLTMFSCSIMT